MLNVCEIFTSIQGESTLAGRLCTFVRLAGCNLRCKWCDTKYSYEKDWVSMSPDDILREIKKNNTRLVEITGGEPLLQRSAVFLCEKLLAAGYSVMIETNGSRDISVLPPSVRRIIDVKCPGSGVGDSFLLDNLKHIRPDDELKFVLSSIEDAAWAKDFCIDHPETKNCTIIFSPVSSSLSYNILADWMVENHIDGIRLGIQLHKVIWGDAREK